MQTETNKEVLKAELEPEAVQKRRRQALGRGLGALLMRARLGTAARQMPTMTVPKWAVGWEPEHQAFLKRVIARAGGRQH